MPGRKPRRSASERDEQERLREEQRKADEAELNAEREAAEREREAYYASLDAAIAREFEIYEKRARELANENETPSQRNKRLGVRSFLTSEYGQSCRVLEYWLENGRRLFNKPVKGSVGGIKRGA